MIKWPKCIKRKFKLKIPSIIENHDLTCLIVDTNEFNPYAGKG